MPLIHNAAIRNSPVKDVFSISIPLAKEDAEGRMSWDQTAVLVAVRGSAPYYTETCGFMTVNDDGSNGWDTTRKEHCRLVEARPASEVREVIDELMMHLPVPASSK